MEETQNFSEDLRRYLALAWQWAWLLILASVLAGGTAYYLSSRMTPLYQASTLMLINPGQSLRTDDYSNVITGERLASTYSQMLVSRPVLEEAIQKLDLAMTSSQLKGMVTVAPVRDTQLIRLDVRDANPYRAALIANTLVLVFADQNLELQRERYAESKASLEAQLALVGEQMESVAAELAELSNISANRAERERLEAALAQYTQTYAGLLSSYEQVRVTEAQSISRISQVEAATPPVAPVSPRVFNNTALAAVVGLMLAVGVIFLFESLNDTLRGPDDVTRHLGLPVLGLIAHHPQEEDGMVVAEQPRSPVSEAFRALRTNILYTSVDKPLESLLITSPSAQEGKTTVAANLAAALSQSGQKVVLLDADMRRPRVHKLLNMPNWHGLSDLFLRPWPLLNGSIRPTGQPNLGAITTGSLPPNPSELLGSEKMVEIIKQALQETSIVVLDSPPVLAVTDAVVLAPRVDGVLLVLIPGVTRLGSARQAVEQLHRVGANLLGVVLNGVNLKRSRYYYYQYQAYYQTYTSGYGESPHKGKRKKCAKDAVDEPAADRAQAPERTRRPQIGRSQD
jgi:capsular exopolysaccharide synthesis family protein